MLYAITPQNQEVSKLQLSNTCLTHQHALLSANLITRQQPPSSVHMPTLTTPGSVCTDVLTAHRHDCVQQHRHISGTP